MSDHPKLNAVNALRFVAGELKRLGAEWDGHDAHAAYKECLAGLAAEEKLAFKPLDCKPLPEDAAERRMFDRDVGLNGDVRVTIVSTLRTSSHMYPAGSFGKRLAIMANEVAKLEMPRS